MVDPFTKKVLRELTCNQKSDIENELDERRQLEVRAKAQKKGEPKEWTDRPNGYMSVWSSKGKRLIVGKNKLLHLINAENWILESSHTIKMPLPAPKDCIKWLNSDPVISRMPAAGTEAQLSETLKKYFDQLDVYVSSLSWIPGTPSVGIGTSVGGCIWNAGTNDVPLHINTDPTPARVNGAIFSPDGLHMAGHVVPDGTALGDMYWNLNKALKIVRPMLCIWDARTGKIIQRYQDVELPEGGRSKLFWSNDSQKLAWSSDNKLVIYDVWKQGATVLLRSQDSQIDHLSWSPKNNMIAIHDSKEGVVVYDVYAGHRKGAFKESIIGKYPDLGQRVFSWSHSGHAIAVGGSGQTIDVWKVAFD